jgi:mannitol/fructose-specific phosphotransferase system IIA component (Ntr-type)
VKRVREVLQAHLRPDRVYELPPGQTKAETLRWLGERACGHAGVERIDEVLAGLAEREGLLSTGIGFGVALPHLRHDAIPAEVICVGRAREGIDFEAIDGKPVHLIFCILGPKGRDRRQIEILGAVAASLKDEARRAQVMQAPDAAALVERLLQ